MNSIKITDSIAREYAKKIMGFAYSKTHNQQMAEDLSQDILLTLGKAMQKQTEIVDMDGFVYTVSCYTWSSYFRQNKKHWNNAPIDNFFDLQSENNIEEDLETKILIEKLQTEIAYLTKLHRSITLLFYYENKKGNEISEILNIPHSTVRWHLGEIKKKLKEGLTMTNNDLNYNPQRIMCGHDGWTSNGDQAGLGDDRLVDNICIACYGTPLTTEEIARKLMVASAYIEGHIEKLVYMDYLKVVDKNKYITNFFIETLRQQAIQGRFHFENIGEYAEKIFKSFDKRYDRIKSIGFLGSELDKDFVLWAIMPLVLNDLYYGSLNAVLRKNKIVIDTPIRKDGSRHWVCATLCDDNYFKEQTEFTKEEIDFLFKSTGNGIKTRNDELGRASLQLDSRATINTGIHWRNFDALNLGELYGISKIIRSGEEPGELDKLIIVRVAEQGYVKMVDDKPVMLIPYFTKDEFDKLGFILNEIKEELSLEFFVPYIEKFAKVFETEIPGFLSKEEKIYHLYKIPNQYAVLYWLSDNGFLRYPTDEEAKRLCTVAWNIK